MDDQTKKASTGIEAQSNPTLLYQKIWNVMRSIKSIEKDSTNSHFNYKYTSEAQVLSEVREKFIENKILFIPSVIRRTKEGDLTTLEVSFSLIDVETGFSKVLVFFGSGKDQQDKGDYKALTGALKYALLKTFMIPTGDDPEKDTWADSKESVSQDKCPVCGTTNQYHSPTCPNKK